MKAFFLTFLLFFSAASFSSEHNEFFETQVKLLIKMKENKYKNINIKKCREDSAAAKKIATNKNLTNEERSMGHAIHSAYLGLFAKRKFKSWKPWKAVPLIELAFSHIKTAIELDHQNTYAVIGHGKLIYRAYENKRLVQSLTNINLPKEKAEALFNFDNLQDRSDPDYEKYKERLLKL